MKPKNLIPLLAALLLAACDPGYSFDFAVDNLSMANIPSSKQRRREGVNGWTYYFYPVRPERREVSPCEYQW